MEVRALWDNLQTPTTTFPAVSTCTPFILPASGVIQIFEPASQITLAQDATFTPSCAGSSELDVTIATEAASTMAGEDLRDPFYASTLPAIYALAAATVTAYMLVIMLFITPRTFISGGTVVLGRRGFASSASGEAGIGIGGRPWLQKVAALSVAISLSIATASTFHIAEAQYNAGYMDAKVLQDEVLQGMELKIIMTISNAFLWLAQAQTLIRLFPRQREKVIIKWTALALISLSLLFSTLNQFVYSNTTRPDAFVDAIPALSYLFQLALELLYLAWVMYYALTKKQYAFYHPRMRNMCLLALISIISVLVPVVFFVVDISKPNVAGWGNYVRWVGAAAASVVVWEWVERIEALERNEKKDGVLGREVFDGDEMLEVTPSIVVSTGNGGDGDKDGGGGRSSGTGGRWPTMTGPTSRHRPRGQQDGSTRRRNTDDGLPRHNSPPSVPLPLSAWPTRPPPAATPISRTDTSSAESTVYAVRYHPIGEVNEAIPEDVSSRAPSRATFDIEAQHDDDTDSSHGGKQSASIDTRSEPPSVAPKPATRIWQALDSMNPFSRKRHKPPPEVSAHTVRQPSPGGKEGDSAPATTRWDLLGKLEDFVTAQARKAMARTKVSDDTSALPVTRIAAPPRRRTIHEIQEELERDEAATTRPLAEAPTRARARPPSPSPPLAYRGSLSFAAALQRDWEEQEHEALWTRGSPASPSPAAQGGPVGPPTEPRSPLVDAARSPPERSPSGRGRAPGAENLPVLRIPAPPLRSRSGGGL